MVNKYLILLLGIMLVLPMVSADNSGWKLYPDKVLYNGVENTTPEFWIDQYHLDNEENKVYHIDALRDLYIDENNESNNEKVRLYLPYKVQPDWIKHINHKGEYVRTYFPTNEDWEWEYECNPDVEDCTDYEGYVILRVDKIDKGLGSNTFPIGVTGAQWVTQGQNFGEFDGDSSYTVITDNGLSSTLNNEFTLALWFKVDEWNSDNPGNYIFWRNDDAPGIQYWNTSNKISFKTNGSSGGVNSDPLNFGQWYQGIMTYNGTHNLAYMDGEYIGIYEDGLTNNSGLIQLGRDDNPDRNLNGGIDEVLIYNRTLSQAEITALYNNYTVTSTGIQRTGTPSTDGLVLNINFDDSSVADLSGEGNHGTNTNVSFGVVSNDEVTLVKGTDYTITSSTFTLLNPDYYYSAIEYAYYTILYEVNYFESSIEFIILILPVMGLLLIWFIFKQIQTNKIKIQIGIALIVTATLTLYAFDIILDTILRIIN